jgi:cell division transport system permease protein
MVGNAVTTITRKTTPVQTPGWLASLQRENRIFGRILAETQGGLRRSGWMTLIIMITMAAILSLFGLLLSGLLEANQFINSLGSSVRVSVYLNDESNLQDVLPAVKQVDHVRQVDVITKEQAWQTMSRTYELPDIANPLPNALHVEVTNPDQLEAVSQTLQKLPGVEAVNYPRKQLVRIQQLARLLSWVGVLFLCFLSAMTMFIISNTIHLLIQAKGREIEILRMMGVGNWYIRLPFLLQGGFYGLGGALMGSIPVVLAWFYVRQASADWQLGATSEATSVVVMVVLGVLVGSGGAVFAVRRYLSI